MKRAGTLSSALLLALACTTGNAIDEDDGAVSLTPTVGALGASAMGSENPGGMPTSVPPNPSSQPTLSATTTPGTAEGGGPGMPTEMPTTLASSGAGGDSAGQGGSTGRAGASFGQLDAGQGGVNDAAAGCAPFVMPDDCTIPEGAVLPAELRCTGLYGDWESRELRCDVTGYAPAYTLWSDGSAKQRYFSVPVGGSVDVTEPNGFLYPLGTKFWKEFSAPEVAGGRLLETRLLERVDGGWLYTSYVWSEDESTAVQNNDGVADLYGTGHTVPARQQCKECHSGRADYVLGWDAVLLGEGATGVTWESLGDAPWVTWEGKETGAPLPAAITVPGDETEKAALGYLHANCGVSCHNDSTNALALETGFFTRLDAETSASPQDSLAFSTGYLRSPSPNAPLMELEPAPDGQSYVNLRPLDTEGSLMLVRMRLRNVDAAMPRIGTNLVDETGVAIIQSWIENMTEERGYPPVAP
jgi:hypothetical protein